jgi:hypothetical protein
MTASRQVFTGTLVALALAVALEFMSHGDLVVIVGGGILLIIALIRGKRLPLALRVFATAMVFYWAYINCLIGRTMQPGLSGYTVRMALTFFAIFGLWPGLALFRLWNSKTTLLLLGLLFPVAFLLASAVAGTEECLFVRKYRVAGVGTTPRWTVSNHWLAYDKVAQRLDGSD